MVLFNLVNIPYRKQLHSQSMCSSLKFDAGLSIRRLLVLSIFVVGSTCVAEPSMSGELSQGTSDSRALCDDANGVGTITGGDGAGNIQGPEKEDPCKPNSEDLRPGGGPVVRGKYSTIYSSGLYTPHLPLDKQDIPGLGAIVEFFRGLDSLSFKTRNEYVAALSPSSARNYFAVDKGFFTKAVYERLVEDHKHANNYYGDFELHAVTHIRSKTTFLLPSFFELSPTEQQAQLFHEAYWLVHPKKQLVDVNTAEAIFQAHLENRESLPRLRDFILTIGRPGDIMSWAMKTDRETEQLEQVIAYLCQGKGVHFNRSSCTRFQNRAAFPVLDIAILFGKDWRQCTIDDFPIEVCYQVLVNHLGELSERFSQSQLLWLFYNRAALGKLSVENSYNDRLYWTASHSLQLSNRARCRPFRHLEFQDYRTIHSASTTGGNSYLQEGYIELTPAWRQTEPADPCEGHRLVLEFSW